MAGAEADAFAESAAIIPSEKIVLFNGRDLTGLRTWLVDSKRDDPRHVFSVSNGVLRISGDGLGYVRTDSAYRDYHLLVEFRWGAANTRWGDRLGKARDSGVFLHATGPDGNSHDGGGAFMAALECQVMEGSVGDILLIRGTSSNGAPIVPRVTVETEDSNDADGWPFWKPRGQVRNIERWGRVNRLHKSRHWRDEFGFKEIQPEIGPPQWNRLECVCADDRLTITLNGRTVNEASKVFPGSGRILLQCEGSEVFFRRFELMPLPARSK
jgi:hypothetical protein